MGRDERCIYFSGKITPFLGGLLSKKDADLVRNHLANCVGCNDHYKNEVDQGPTE